MKTHKNIWNYHLLTQVISKHRSQKQRSLVVKLAKMQNANLKAKVMTHLQKELDKRLYFAFANKVIAATSQVIELAEQTEIVPISNRGMEFFSPAILIKLYH